MKEDDRHDAEGVPARPERSILQRLADAASALFPGCFLADAGQWPGTVHDAGLASRTLLDKRRLVLVGGHNFRDLGGLPAAGGRRVIAGRFFRGDEMGDLDDADLAVLAALPLRTVVDLRTRQEAEDDPDRLPASVAEALHYPIVPGNLDQAYSGGIRTAGDMESFMFGVYRRLPTDDAILSRYRLLFKAVQNESKLPLLFHCTAGKDRTGMAAAFLLSALGADRETVVDDYLASNICLANKYRAFAERYPEMVPGLFVRREYLETALDAIDDEHGSMEKFLADVLDVDVEALRAAHLE